MHSRIIQVSPEPVERDEYIRESSYWDHWFTREIADYVAISDRDKDIEWLSTNGYKGIVFDKDECGEFFIIKDKEEFFAKRFEKFKEELAKVNEITLYEFAHGKGIWWLESTYEEKYGFYIHDTDCDYLTTLDEFIRTSDTDVKYYIGGTMDYHC